MQIKRIIFSVSHLWIIGIGLYSRFLHVFPMGRIGIIRIQLRQALIFLIIRVRFLVSLREIKAFKDAPRNRKTLTDVGNTEEVTPNTSRNIPKF